MKYHYTNVQMAIIKNTKTQKRTSVSEGGEQLEPLWIMEI